MVIIISFILISLLIGVANWCAHKTGYHSEDKYYGFGSGFCWPLAIFATVCIIVWTVSYDSSVDMLQTRAVIEQKVTAINSYRSIATNSFADKAVTDLKYNNYQQEMAKMITDLRKCVEGYNQTLIGKMAYKASPLFSWFVFSPPPNSHVISLSTYLSN